MLFCGTRRNFLSARRPIISYWLGASRNWNNNGSVGWAGTGIPKNPGDSAIFAGGTGGTTTVETAGYIIGRLEFSLGNVLRTIATTYPLTFNNNGAQAVIINLNPNTGASNRLTLSNASTTTYVGSLLVSNTGGSTNTTAAVTLSGVLDGSGPVTISNVSNVDNSGSILFSAANTFSGNVLIQKGIIELTSTGFNGSGNTVTLGSSGNGSATLLFTASITNPLIVASGTGGTLKFGSLSTGGSNATFSGTILLNDSLTLSSAKAAAASLIFSAVISGTGGITKVGVGRVTFSATNTYTGTTLVSVGILSVTGSTAAGSAVTVDGGTLLGTGTVNGTVTVANTANSIIAGGLGTVNGTLNTGALTFSGSTAALNVYSNGTTSLGLVNVTGAAVMGGVTVNLMTAMSAGTYNLVTASGGCTGTATVGTNNSGRVVGSLLSVGNNLVLVLT